MPIALTSGEDDGLPMINKMNPTTNLLPEPRAGAPEKWLALAGPILVTVAAVILFGR